MTPVGIPGTLALELGETDADCAEGVPVPIALVAATVKVYGEPFVNPVMAYRVADVPVTLAD